VNALLFLAIRAAHVLLAAVWIGSTVFVTALLMPAVEAAGPSGGQTMMRLSGRGIVPYMAALGVTTVLTGVYLLWHFTGGFDPTVATSHAGLAFGIGGAAGILAGIIGGSVVGRNSSKIAKLMKDTAGAPPSGAVLEQVAVLRRQMAIGHRAVIALQMTALVLMAVGHYV